VSKISGGKRSQDARWEEGKKIAIERRYAEENEDRLDALAAELVQLG